MYTIVFEVDNFADLVRLASDTNMSKLTTEEFNAVKTAFANTFDTHLQLDIRLTRNFDLNYSDYWNKPEGSTFINMNRSRKTINYPGGGDYSVYLYKCIDGGIYNGNNEVIGKHSITNIYLRQGSVFMNIPYVENDPINVSPAMKNIDIEVVSNSGYVVYNANGEGSASNKKDNRIFHNVCFNIKAYNLTKPLFYMKRTNGYSETGSPYGLIQFENCVFNIYIAVINDTDNTKNNIISVDSTAGYSGAINFYSCIFRIRNASNRVYSIVYDIKYQSNSPMLAFKMDNCAIFLQDIGVEKPPYQNEDSPAQTFGKVCILRVNPNAISTNANCFKFVNSYIAAFGDVSATDKVQVLLVGYGPNFVGLSTYATNCSSSFYDKDKLKVLYWADGSLQEVDQVWLRPLTTAECKDTNKLSEIGYIFCEET